MNITSVIELRDAVGTKAKKSVIKKYSKDEWFRTFLYYALNPTISYNLSENTLRFAEGEAYPIASVLFKDIFDCCESISRFRGIDNATVLQVKALLYNTDEPEREIFTKLLAKTLRLGVTAKTVNKVIPNLVPEWEVQQAFPIDKYPVKVGTEFWLTQKLNGVRATFYNGQLIARSGLPFQGLEHITKDINFVSVAGFVLDGELILKDNGSLSDNEAFRKVTGIINSDSVDKTEVCFRVFDAIPLNDFESANPTTKYSVRRTILDELEKQLNKDGIKTTTILGVLYHGNDLSMIDKFLDQMVAEDKEGLMLNKDVPYRRKRHKGILKIKRFYTMDLPIVRCEEGTGRLQGTLGAFVLNYKGNEVKVGSGFSDEQRMVFWQHRKELEGTLCEVKYKEISSDKNTGLQSLQFPVFVTLRTDKTEMSEW